MGPSLKVLSPQDAAESPLDFSQVPSQIHIPCCGSSALSFFHPGLFTPSSYAHLQLTVTTMGPRLKVLSPQDAAESPLDFSQVPSQIHIPCCGSSVLSFFHPGLFTPSSYAHLQLTVTTMGPRLKVLSPQDAAESPLDFSQVPSQIHIPCCSSSALSFSHPGLFTPSSYAHLQPTVITMGPRLKVLSPPWAAVSHRGSVP